MAKAKADGAMATAKGAIALYVAFMSTGARIWLVDSGENGPDSGDDWMESDPKWWWMSMKFGGFNLADGLDVVVKVLVLRSSTGNVSWLLNPLVLGLELVESGCVVDSSSCKKSERSQ
ncbi:hypothetical protein AMTRI_Chr05g72920 [Amborella trichopoda]